MAPLPKDEILFIIPAYNEEKTIGRVIDDIKSEGFKNILVIDDGSTDSTYHIALEQGVEIIRHPINRGQGAALKTGMEFFLKHTNLKYLVTFDADGQHDVKQVYKLIVPVLKGDADVALGSRFLAKNNLDLKRRLILKGGILFTFLISGVWLTDTHNGYRVLNRKAVRLVDIKLDDFSHASEILDEISKKNLKFAEVPIKIIYTNYSRSKGQRLTNAFRIVFKVLMKDFIE